MSNKNTKKRDVPPHNLPDLECRKIPEANKTVVKAIFILINFLFFLSAAFAVYAFLSIFLTK